MFKNKEREVFKMQAIVETLFDAVYLISVITIGITMIVKCRGIKEYRLFGIMPLYLARGCISSCAKGNRIVYKRIGGFYGLARNGKIYYIHNDDNFLYFALLCMENPL